MSVAELDISKVQDRFEDESSIIDHDGYVKACEAIVTALGEYVPVQGTVEATAEAGAKANMLLRLAIRMPNGDPDLSGTSAAYVYGWTTYLDGVSEQRGWSKAARDAFRTNTRNYMSYHAMIQTEAARWVAANDSEVKTTPEAVETAIGKGEAVQDDVKAAVRKLYKRNVSTNGRPLNGMNPERVSAIYGKRAKAPAKAKVVKTEAAANTEAGHWTALRLLAKDAGKGENIDLDVFAGEVFHLASELAKATVVAGSKAARGRGKARGQWQHLQLLAGTVAAILDDDKGEDADKRRKAARGNLAKVLWTADQDA